MATIAAPHSFAISFACLDDVGGQRCRWTQSEFSILQQQLETMLVEVGPGSQTGLQSRGREKTLFYLENFYCFSF
jgi:hypothetical protein